MRRGLPPARGRLHPGRRRRRRTRRASSAARRNSPLVVGLGDGEIFLGSDVAAFIEHTREALELGQDQVVTITARRRRGHRLRRRRRPRARRYHVDWDLVGRREGRLRLLHAQGDRRAAARGRRHPARPASTPTGGSCSTRCGCPTRSCATIDKIFIVACGTAFHAGLVAKYAIEHWTRIPCEVELASEFRYRDPILTAPRWSSRSASPARPPTP